MQSHLSLQKEKIDTFRNWYRQDYNIRKIRNDYEYEYKIDIEITYQSEKRKFQLEIYRSRSKSYSILLFEVLQTSKGFTLRLVMHRNILCKRLDIPYTIFDPSRDIKTHFPYEFYGTWLSVNPIYQRQDIALFSYYIYALILNRVEVIQHSPNYGQVVLTADDVSTVRSETQHEKCVYCPYYSPAFYLYPSGQSVENSRMTDVQYMLNPKKMQKVSENVGHIQIDGSWFDFQDTRLHFYVPIIHGDFINIVMSEYEKKKRKGVPSIGLLLIEQCENERLEGILKLWGTRLGIKMLDVLALKEAETARRQNDLQRKEKRNMVHNLMSKDMLYFVQLAFDSYMQEKPNEKIYVDIDIREGESILNIPTVLELTFTFRFTQAENTRSKRMRSLSDASEMDLYFNQRPGQQVIVSFICFSTRYGAAKIKLLNISPSTKEDMLISFYIAHTMCKKIVADRMKMEDSFLISTIDFDNLLFSNRVNTSSAKKNLFVDNVVSQRGFENIKWWAPGNYVKSPKRINRVSRLQQNGRLVSRIFEETEVDDEENESGHGEGE